MSNLETHARNHQLQPLREMFGPELADRIQHDLIEPAAVGVSGRLQGVLPTVLGLDLEVSGKLDSSKKDELSELGFSLTGSTEHFRNGEVILTRARGSLVGAPGSVGQRLCMLGDLPYVVRVAENPLACEE